MPYTKFGYNSRTELQRHGLMNRVVFLGSLPPEKVAETMRKSHVLVVTSAFEAGPKVILEALACGIPVVSTDVGLARRVVRKGLTGEVVQGRDPYSLARALLQVLEPGIMKRVGTFSLERYDARRVLAQVYSFFQGLAPGGKEWVA